MDARLLDIMVCPVCKGPLQHDRKAQELICNADKLAFPIRDGIPVMWTDQARDLAAPSTPAAPAAQATAAAPATDTPSA